MPDDTIVKVQVDQAVLQRPFGKFASGILAGVPPRRTHEKVDPWIGLSSFIHGLEPFEYQQQNLARMFSELLPCGVRVCGLLMRVERGSRRPTSRALRDLNGLLLSPLEGQACMFKPLVCVLKYADHCEGKDEARFVVLNEGEGAEKLSYVNFIELPKVTPVDGRALLDREFFAIRLRANVVGHGDERYFMERVGAALAVDRDAVSEPLRKFRRRGKREITLTARGVRLTRLCSHAPVAALLPVRVGQY